VRKRVSLEIGMEYNLLTALKCVDENAGTLRYTLRCRCGNTVKDTYAAKVKAGHIKSCGCIKRGVKVGSKVSDKSVVYDRQRIYNVIEDRKILNIIQSESWRG